MYVQGFPQWGCEMEPECVWKLPLPSTKKIAEGEEDRAFKNPIFSAEDAPPLPWTLTLSDPSIKSKGSDLSLALKYLGSLHDDL